MRIVLGFFSFFLFLVFYSCSPGVEEDLQYVKIAGFAQGTSYHITYSTDDSINFQPQIDSFLNAVDASLSTYDSLSVISRINANIDLSVDDKFIEVFEMAKEINKLSGGAFDITVMPLVNAWGFGPGLKKEIDNRLIDSLLVLVGMDKVSIHNNKLMKTHPGISLDVNAIAQGYSVDLLADFLAERGVENYMVEVGGEIKTRGENPGGQAWRIGIDKPETGNLIPGQQLQAIIQISNTALATSGNYRKFYEKDGVKYSHSIDPVTGYPVQNQVLSATVINSSCMKADALATACMVMGLENAQEMITEEGLFAYLIYGDEEGRYRVWYSDGFRDFIVKDNL